MDIFLPHLNTALAGIFAMLLFSFYYLVVKRSRSAKRKLPPKVAGAWPLIGHLHLLGGSQLPHVTLGVMADRYGPVFNIRLGLHTALVVSSWEVAKECFTTHDAVIASRPKLVASKHLGHNYAGFGFAPYGPYWREMRKIASLELLSNRRLDLLKHVRASEVETSIKELYKLWCQKKNGSGHVLVEMKQWFGDLTLNVVLRMVVGKRYHGSTTVSARDEKEARRCQKAIRDFFHLLGLFVVGDAIPFLGWLDLGGHVKAMKKTGKEMDSIASEWLEEHKRKRAFKEETDGDQDFMDVMLSVLEDTKCGDYDADIVNKATSLSLITGGSDTTMVTLTWALSLLLNNLHVLKKAQDELDLYVGRERLVNESDISKLVYLRAIFKETLRLYPPGPLSGPREVTEDCTIGGYHVPAGTRVLVNLTKIQRDPRIWSDPLEFRPERFLTTTHKDVDVKGQHFELIPFGSGRRACPGISFGLQVIHLALANLLHAFDISTLSNEPVDMGEIFGLTNIRATPLEVLVTPRLPPGLYE